VVTRTFFRSVRNKLQQIFPYSKSLQQWIQDMGN
jgi:hypothetical protein